MNNFTKRVLACIAQTNEVERDYQRICGHFQLKQDLQFDTDMILDLVMEIEDMFCAQLPSEVEEDWYIVDDVIDSVRLVGGK